MGRLRADIDPLDILYQDRWLVAVNKPAGMAIHRSPGMERGQPLLLQTLRNQLGCWIYPVHRLDRPTSGVVLFGLERAVARSLSRMLARRKVRKTYLAVVRGWVAERGVIDRPLRPDAYKKKRGEPVPAKTAFRRLATGQLPYPVGPFEQGRYSLVAAFPLTGRMHQIRRHFRAAGHPIIGDTAHGDREHNRLFAETLGCRRMLLAAVRIGLRHPRTGRRLVIDCPVDGDVQRILERMGWREAVCDRWLADAGQTEIEQPWTSTTCMP